MSPVCVCVCVYVCVCVCMWEMTFSWPLAKDEALIMAGYVEQTSAPNCV